MKVEEAADGADAEVTPDDEGDAEEQAKEKPA
jgi:hypothetical protein